MKTFYLLLTTATLIVAGFGSTGCKREAVERTAVEQQDDEKITELVKESLSNSPTYKFPDVQVATHKAKVQLSGFVLTDDQKRAAGELARTVPGVVEVENKISRKE